MLLFSIFSWNIQAQRGLVLSGYFGQDRFENSLTSGGIRPADTSPVTIHHQDYTNRSISIPDVVYMKLEGKRLRTHTFGGSISHSIRNSTFSKNKREFRFGAYFAYAEHYNYLSFFDSKLRFYIGGKLSTYFARDYFFEPEYQTSLSLSAYTNITYLYKKRYWFEIGLEKAIAGTFLRIPTTMQKPIFAFNNDLDSEFYPISVGFGLLF